MKDEVELLKHNRCGGIKTNINDKLIVAKLMVKNAKCVPL